MNDPRRRGASRHLFSRLTAQELATTAEELTRLVAEFKVAA
jgi:hypothetical protein